MQTVNLEHLNISPEAYLEGEKVAEVRHEYIDGAIYAMAGGSDAHARISGNAFVLLKAHLRGSACSTYLGEMKAKASITQYLYPDLMVTCDEDDRTSNYSKSRPLLIIEVLSKSTEGYDRGKKFEYYRQIETLQEYALIDQAEYHVDLFRKNSDQRWELFSFYRADTELCFISVDCCFTLKELYEDVDFELARADVAAETR